MTSSTESQNTSLPVEVNDSQFDQQVWGPWATAGFGLMIGIVALFIVALVVVIFFAVDIASGNVRSVSQLIEDFRDVEGLFASLATIASAIVCVGLILIIIKARRGAIIAEYLGLRRITRKTILVLLGVTLGLAVLSDVIGLLLGGSISEDMVNIYDTSVWPALLWIAVIDFAPIFEEAFFRGFLFESFRQSRIGLVGTIGLVALLWTLLHIPYGLYGIVTIFVLGIVLGIARFKTNSLWTPILMHAFWNLIASVEVAINGLLG